MKNKIKTSLLISTYNWSEALELVLLSVLRQSLMPHEVLIADDGSDDKTKVVVEAFKKNTDITVHHIWHEDKGFRKAIILNKAIAKSTSDYIIQVDGDCFLHPNFVEDHVNNIQEKLYLFGTRVRIKQKFVNEIISSRKIDINFFSKGLKKRPRSLRIPFLSKFFSIQNSISPKFRGCNTSFWKEDFIKVNGYNEGIQGWGREDSELMIRFHNNSIKGKRLKFCGIVYHLDHNEADKNDFKKNDKIQQKTIVDKIKWSTHGIDKYL